MKMLSSRFVLKSAALILSISAIFSFYSYAADKTYSSKPAENKVADPACPALGWSENLVNFLKPDGQIPTDAPKNDCAFHEWSWETFVWAIALDANNTPRFMSLPTPADLLGSSVTEKNSKAPKLKLAARLHGNTTGLEGAGAIVEADGNMLVAQNGYPVYASVHMNQSYFATAKNNMIANGGYQKNVNDYFQVGAAVFKATWLRIGDGPVPDGAFVTMADVPVLTIQNNVVVPQTDKSGNIVTVTAKVALVGLHVVGITQDHPEFLWATFEHKDNSPMIPDNQFSTSGSDPKSYTFYKANTPFSQVNQANTQPSPATKQTPVLSFDVKTQKFSPVTNAVLENKTGGETFSPQGPQNISNLNQSSQSFLAGKSKNQAVFANYGLIGTVWFSSNTYVDTNPNWPNLNQVNAIGSVNLANVTAETFVQQATSTPQANVQNCFMCHNAQSYSFSTPKLNPRRIAISHVLAENVPVFEVPNVMPLCWNVSAGPIWSNADAQTKCPTACGATSWNGQWVTTTWGVESVCGCCNK